LILRDGAGVTPAASSGDKFEASSALLLRKVKLLDIEEALSAQCTAKQLS
jgi:hypothetical protein